MPQVKGAPSALNELLERVYDNCIKDGGSKTTCSIAAWSAAKKAGWTIKSGKWVKK